MRYSVVHSVLSLSWPVLCFFLCVPIGLAQDISKPNPNAPVLSTGFPLGAQRGTVLDITFTGKNLSDPIAVYTSFNCTAQIPTDKNNGKDPAKLQIHLEIPRDAPLGFHKLRLAGKTGISNLRVLCIDDLPEIRETPTNGKKSTPQVVKTPCVVTGRLDNLASDYFQVSVQAGQQLSFEVLGHRLGGPIDPRITLYSVKTGLELASANDSPGLQTDCRITWTFKEAGDYLLEVRDVLSRGGADYGYRLRIGDFPCATTALPLYAERGKPALIHFAGPNVKDAKPVQLTPPADAKTAALWAAPQWTNGLFGWPVVLGLSSFPEVLEKEPNQDQKSANRISVPGGISGQLDKYGDTDIFVFTAKKGDKLALRAETLELNSPALVYFEIKNGKGNVLGKSNPQANPPDDQRIEFNVPDDGDYFVELQHLNFLGGPGETYHLAVQANDPGFELTCPLDRYDVPKGGGILIPVKVKRKNYTEVIQLQIVSPQPGVLGLGSIPAGKDTGVVALYARDDAPLGPLGLHISGQAVINGKTVTELVTIGDALSNSLANLTFPPLNWINQIDVAVTPQQPFRLVAKLAQKEFLPGSDVPITLSIQRDEGFTAPITLQPPQGWPGNPNFKAPPAIARDKASVDLKLKLEGNVALADYPISIPAKGKDKNREWVVYSVPVELVVSRPFVLKAAAAKVHVKQGGKATIKITAQRLANYDGPITLEVRNLPANVQAAKVTIAKGQTVADIEITVPDNVAIGPKTDVNVLGTATAAGNQQAASPNFVVEIQKK
jgi:hypothetical protein